MDINKYIHTLMRQSREPSENRNEVRERLTYAMAYRQGEKGLKRYRDRAIEREIGKTHSEGAQIAILFNKDKHPDEYEVYQTLRTECKARVDAKMAKLEADLEASLSGS